MALLLEILRLFPRLNPAYPTAAQGTPAVVIPDNSVTFSEMQPVSANVFLGAVTAGPIQELPISQAGRNLVAAADAAAQRSVLGLSTVATFSALTGMVHSDNAGNTTIQPNVVTEAMQNLSDVTTLNVSSSKHGYAPKSPGNATLFLNGNTTPAYAAVKDSDLSVSDVTTNNASTSQHGFLKKLDGNVAHFMAGDGNWSTALGPVTSDAGGNVSGVAALTATGLITGAGLTITGSNPITMPKATDPGTAPGAGLAKMYWVAGTGAGTGKLIAYAGTSTTPSTIVDNVGGGF